MSIAALVATKPIQFGDQGPAVQATQAALATLGYKLKGTAYFGGATDAAVEHFQRSHNLAADGVVGRLTGAVIDEEVAGGSIASQTVQAEILRPLWVTAAIKLLNVREAPGKADNPEILAWAKEEGGAIARDYTHDSIPWCALYANAVLTQVGLKGTGTLWALDFAKWGVSLAGPAVGAFAPMRRDGGGHIAIVVGRDQHSNLMMIGGNQRDEVSIRPFPQSRPVSFRWPAGPSLPAVTGFSSLPVIRSDGRLSSSEA